MEIKVFGDLTQEDVIKSFEVEAEKYNGLYVDMDEAEGRKYVKAQAKTIGDLIKKLDRARIDKAAKYKREVESEFSVIKSRLEKANEPFTLLIDEYNAERKRILDAEKAKQKAIDDAKQLESDHELALLLNMKWDSEKEQREADKLAEIERIKKQAEADLIAKMQREQEAEKQLKEAAARYAAKAEQDRINNIEHQRKINNEILSDLLDNTELKEADAILIVKLIKNNRIRNLQINY